MILESTAQFFQPIYPQTAMGVDLRIDPMGDMFVQFKNNSGAVTGLGFVLGKVFGSDKLMHTFEYDQPTDVRIEIENNKYSAWVNNFLICASQTLFTGNFDYITGFQLYNGGPEKNVDLTIRGQTPRVSFGNLYTDDLISFTGRIVSNNYPITLFGIEPDTMSVISMPSGAFMTGDYVLSGKNFTSGNAENINFSFNFGQIETGVPITYIDPTIPTGYLSVAFGDVFTDVYERDGDTYSVQYQDVSITSSWPFASTLQYYLEYVGRSGEQTVSGTGVGSGMYSGYVNGSGLVYSNQLEGVIYPHGITGVGSGSYYTYTTGQITYEYIIDVVGIESGKLATGVIWGELTGNIGPLQSGAYLFNQDITGTPSISVWSGGTFISPTGTYTGHVTHLSVLAKYVTVPGTGDFQGTGIIDDLNGSISGFNLITGSISELYNSDYQYSYDNFYNLKKLGHYYGNKLQDPYPVSLYDGLYTFGIRIGYDQQSEGLLRDYANFRILNDFVEYTFPILGNTL